MSRPARVIPAPSPPRSARIGARARPVSPLPQRPEGIELEPRDWPCPEAPVVSAGDAGHVAAGNRVGIVERDLPAPAPAPPAAGARHAAGAARARHVAGIAREVARRVAGRESEKLWRGDVAGRELIVER